MRSKFLITAMALLSTITATAGAADLTRDQLIETGDRIARAQIKAINGRPEISWITGTFYAGLAEFARISPSGGTYRDAIVQVGDKVKWTPDRPKKTPLFGDSQCIGMSWEEVSSDLQKPEYILPLRSRFDELVIELDKPVSPGQKLNWWWCDALFMVPRGLTRMSELTGDPKYIDAMDKEWWRTTDLLYDTHEHLYSRDDSYLKKKTKNGRKVFWARGNGWVIAGLARVLQVMPEKYPSRPKYLKLFQEMTDKLAEIQTPDGTWHASLIDPDEIPVPETSGTSLNCSAIAWGINAGLLDKSKFMPVLLKGYAAMMEGLRPDGLPGYVQNVGAAPDPKTLKTWTTREYASGTYLLTINQMVKMTPIALTEQDKPVVAIAAPPLPPDTQPGK